MAHSARFAPAHLVDLIDESVRQAASTGLILQRTDDEKHSGDHVSIAGAELSNFGGCSYLGLELRAELKDAAIDATRRYGTQFSISRAYLDCGLYSQLEAALTAMVEGNVLVTPSTTLGHIAALPVLLEPGDAVLIDQFAHASIHTATALLRDVPIEVVRHSSLHALDAKLRRLSKTHRRIWYLVDGVYSMLGDFAPLPELAKMLAEHEQLHLYVDDAHATSWLGQSGRGYALSTLPRSERVVVALSLNKAFSAAGGALVFASSEQRDRVRRTGGPMLFSGPIQPPMLGAALASAKLHTSPAFPALQRALQTRIELVTSLARQHDVRLENEDATPIFFVRCGPTELTFELVRELRKRGFYTCPSVFPAVPANRSGVRFTVSLHNRESDIERLMGELATVAHRLGVHIEEREPSGTVPVAPLALPERASGDD